MENLVTMSLRKFYQGKKVLVTGHTGFKGSWLCEWLLSMEAKVTGYALAPNTEPALFDQLGLATRINHRLADIRDAQEVARVVKEVQPDVVFHMAAQPLVRLSYQVPLETYAVNVMGTAHVLEALRALRKPCSAIMVTSDKCYENKEILHGYREDDAMGGHDPYSSSKGAAELVVSAYRRSYFSEADCPVRIASARAGNVIGGGDWALDRIVPDCMRSLSRNEVVAVRNPNATRPWQHVLEPLSGYLWLATCLADQGNKAAKLTTGFNFGPDLSSNQRVATLVEGVISHWHGTWKDCSDPNALHEASLLSLSTDKALHMLEWQPVWDFATTLDVTTQWYRDTHMKLAAPSELTRQQLARYVADAAEQGLAWATN